MFYVQGKPLSAIITKTSIKQKSRKTRCQVIQM